MAISKEFVQSVRRSVADQPEVRFDRLARSLKASEAEVITALPVAMRVKARNTSFDAIWSILTRWESFGPVYMGRHRQLVPLANGLALRLLRQGQLRISAPEDEISFSTIRESVGYIWFISKGGKEGHSISFLDKEGCHMLSIALAAGDRTVEDQSQLGEFEEMKKRFGVVPTPKNRCKGCKSCSCEAAGGEG